MNEISANFLKRKKYVLISLFLLLAMINNSNAQQNVREWILDRTAKFSPFSYALLQRYSRLPVKMEIRRGNSTMSTSSTKNAFEFLELDTKQMALESMSTNIHEIGHMYGGLLHYEELMNCNCERSFTFGDIQQGFYQTPETSFWISIEKKYIFPSLELAESIPSNMITFRYKTYIKGTSSTQGEGVVGLLDEMNAYYLGSRFNYEMYPVYKELYPSDHLNKWVSQTMSIMTAFYEFDFFIKEYLLYAKKYHPQTYLYLKNNEAFKKAYQKIFDNFRSLKDLYEARVKKERSEYSLYYDTFFWKDDHSRLLDRLNSGIYQSIQFDFLN